MTESTHRTQVALYLPDSVPALLLAVQAVLEAMTGNPFFPNPTPPLSTVGAALSELRESQVTAESRTRGMAAVRNEKRTALVSLVKRLKAYVQGVADDDPEKAASIIESAHMSVWKPGPGAKLPFDVKAGAVEGAVRLVVRAAAKEAVYYWQWSADAGKTWSAESKALKANTVLKALPPGQVCLFRYRTKTRKSETDWSEPIAFRVP
ncbi:MAG TPA: hypothetical protein VGL81_13945 [Polyangiaceae bacterium]|jgi:hypothetical protein